MALVVALLLSKSSTVMTFAWGGSLVGTSSEGSWMKVTKSVIPNKKSMPYLLSSCYATANNETKIMPLTCQVIAFTHQVSVRCDVDSHTSLGVPHGRTIIPVSTAVRPRAVVTKPQGVTATGGVPS